MPRSHKEYAGWSPERLLEWAAKSGPCTGQVAEAILNGRPHPQLGFRSCLGLIRLANLHGPERCEAACKRALQLGSPTYKLVKTILDNRAEAAEEKQPAPEREPVRHANIRGADYYRSAQS